MNEVVLEAIIRKFRGPGWIPPTRANHSDHVTQVSAVSDHAKENPNEKEEHPPPVVEPEELPYIDALGTLVIQSSAPREYRWWDGGQSVLQTLIELNANEETLKKYMDRTANDRIDREGAKS